MTLASVAAAPSASRSAPGRPARTFDPLRSGWLALLVSTTARGAIPLLVGLLLWSVAPVAAGWSSTVVLSNSMAPGVLAGDVLLVRPAAPSELHPGQILLVDDPDHAGRLRLHRLTRVDPATGALTLKGDANERADSTTVQTDAVHGAAALRVPWVGSPLVWLQEGRVRLVAAMAAALTALAAGIWCYRPAANAPSAQAPRPARGGGRGSTTLSRALAAQLQRPGASSDRTDTRPLPRVTAPPELVPPGPRGAEIP